MKILSNQSLYKKKHGTDCSAKELFKIIEEEIIKRTHNLIGFLTDGAPVFSGQFKGVKMMTSKAVPGIIIIHCLAQCAKLVGKKSYHQLIYDFDSFLTFLVNNFTNSSTQTKQNLKNCKGILILNQKTFYRFAKLDELTFFIVFKGLIIFGMSLFNILKVFRKK